MNQLLPHLFRTEYSKIVAVLCKVFGLSNIQLAEDIVSDTFLIATETWGLKGIPDHPRAWLYTVSKNKAKDYFKRNNLFTQKIKPELQSKSTITPAIEIDLSDGNIQDSQLRMLFAICNPVISVESQIALALKILCGFGIDEIAKAFLSNKETINKRLHRAKDKFRKHKIELVFPQPKELEERLSNVLSILYLLFNEGYYSSSSEKTIRKEMCLESMRLLHMILAHQPTNQPQSNALMALFCFHSSRFEARINHSGESILYAEQNKANWNFELISKGEYYLNLSASGQELTKYHLEAAIAFWHTKYEETKEKWEQILQLYNQLLQIEYSPITALNRTYALAKANNKKEAIKEALKIGLKGNHLYYSLLAELYHGIDNAKEKKYLKLALKAVDTENERLIILKKTEKINPTE